MERFRRLGRYQQGILIVMAAMVLAFTVAYTLTITREGYMYWDVLLIPSQNNGESVYSGKLDKVPVSFTVSTDKAVTFRYGDRVYGPYTAREDPAIAPESSYVDGPLTGVELCRNGEVIFRGALAHYGGASRLLDEDGKPVFDISVRVPNGVITDKNGNVIDTLEPSVHTILELMYGPTLTHKGKWLAWFFGALSCAGTALSILFADELFRWNMSLQVRDPNRAEPSDWEIASRYFGWTMMPVVALVLFIMGLL